MVLAIDVFSRPIVGLRLIGTMQTYFVFDALEKALYECSPDAHALVYQSERGSQDGFNRLSRHLQSGGVYGATRNQPSVGSRGDR